MATVQPLRLALYSVWCGIRKVWGVRSLHPANQVKRLSTREYISQGEDPQFRMREILPAGWYWVELGIALPGARAIARFYLDYGAGESEDYMHSISLRSERVGRRLLWLSAPARLRLDPFSNSGEFQIQHFRIKKVSEALARQRMRRKLLNVHPRYREHKDGTRKPLPETSPQLWSDYDGVFELRGTSLVHYQEWIEDNEKKRWMEAEAQAKSFGRQGFGDDWPLISVLLPTYNTPGKLLRACLESVLCQSYPKWELCIADDGSRELSVREVLQEYARRDERIKVIYRKNTGHISEASNTALTLVRGSYVALLDHDDELAPHALFLMAKAIRENPGAQVLYSDEDKINSDGVRCDPYFKPNFSPELLLSQNYFSHLGVYKHDLLKEIGGFRTGFEGSQDYDLVLRCVSRVKKHTDIVHVPEVLYHWRIVEGSTAADHGQKEYAQLSAVRALQSYVEQSLPGVKISVIAPGLYRQHWPIPNPQPLVSLIIPTRDHYAVLKACLDSILEKTNYQSYEILVVDNQSACEQTLDYLQQLEASESRVRVLRYHKPFNYSAINNMAVTHARGHIVGFINNDIEVINSEWLSELVSLAVRKEIGCVGAKLYYPDGTLQHGGVILGMGGVAGHAYQNAPKDDPGYFGRLRITYNVSAVTGAVLIVRRSIFEQTGGFNEVDLPVAFNDVDFCLRVLRMGYRNVWTPHARLYHHESRSRGADSTPEKRARFEKECAYMQRHWSDVLSRDPYYNPNLSLQREDYSVCTRNE